MDNVSKIFREWYIKEYGDIPSIQDNSRDRHEDYSEYDNYCHCKSGFQAGYQAALRLSNGSIVAKEYPKTGRHSN